jgi:F-type H+-transporting ATPase subunit epsilon
MRLEIVTPEGAKVQAEVGSVTAPGTVGELGILPGHRPLITSLDIGTLTYVAHGVPAYLAVNGGYLEVADDHIIVITETAERPDQIDLERARAALARAAERLAKVDPSQAEAYRFADQAKRRAESRIRVAKLAPLVIRE